MSSSPSRIPPLITLPAICRQHGLDNAAKQRLHKLLRGCAVVAGVYTVADAERAVARDRARHAPLPERDDLFVCVCGRKFISAECLVRHTVREHSS